MDEWLDERTGVVDEFYMTSSKAYKSHQNSSKNFKKSPEKI